ncbi:MAG: Gldg family protein [Minwuia sp.]|uniref:DUF7088 domain-containing protein n=1 Tax=Minwuia sp. TaxID=2493630 RepID=UPI003A84F3AF
MSSSERISGRDRHLWLALSASSLALAALVGLLWPELRISWILLLLLAALLSALWAAAGGIRSIRDIGLRRALIGGNVATMSAILIALAVFANVVVSLAPWRADVTASSQYTLSPTTLEALARIDKPVEAVALFPDTAAFRAQREAARRLLDLYARESAALTIRFVDPELNPGAARTLGVTGSGVTVFRQGERSVETAAIGERAFTEGLMQVAGIAARTICVMTDLGGPETGDTGPAGLSRAADGLQRALFALRPVSAAAPDLDGCTAVMIAGPRRPIDGPRLAALEAWRDGGGGLLLLADPQSPAFIRSLAEPLGLTVGEAQVADRSVHVGDDPLTPAVLTDRYPPSEVGRGLETTYFPGAAPVELVRDDATEWPGAPAVDANGVAAPVAVTTEAGVLIQPGGNRQPGRYALAAIALRRLGETESRAVVIGDSDFATNAHIYSGGNGQLLINAARWLTGAKPLTDIRARPYAFRRLVLDESQTSALRLTSLAVLPGLALLMALFLWWRRR